MVTSVAGIEHTVGSLDGGAHGNGGWALEDFPCGFVGAVPMLDGAAEIQGNALDEAFPGRVEVHVGAGEKSECWRTVF